MAVVLGIDAAWTERQPSGIALLADSEGGRRAICVAPSYESFVALAEGRAVDWAAGSFRGSAPPVREVLSAAESLAGAHVDCVAVDMPVSKVPFTGRRVADQAISKAFGHRGCSTLSPSQTRPGPLGHRLMTQLDGSGYPLATNAVTPVSERCTIEVYPHPALLRLLGRGYRVPYKASNSGKYWRDLNREQRVSRLVEEYEQINVALRIALASETSVPVPPFDSGLSFSVLKRYEDALDALVCAWVGCRYRDRTAVAYGDDKAAIWVPQPPASLSVFHRTTEEAASRILQEGFKDGEGNYMTSRTWRGVWVSDRPLDANEGAYGEILLQLVIPLEVFEDYEWVADKHSRESLIPAAFLNACGRPTVATEK